MTCSLKKILGIIAIAVTAAFPLQATMDTTCEASYCANGCCGHFFVDADVLYLKAAEEGLSGRYDSIDITNFVENDVFISSLRGKSHEPDFGWHFGMRLGLGFGFGDSRTGFEAYWTHFNSQTPRNNGENQNKWKINFNVSDILYGYEYPFGCNSVLIPFVGLRYANISQQLNSRFIDTVDGNPLLSIGRLKEKFSGTGPLFGIRGDQKLGKGFTIYCDLAASLLFGTFNVKSHTEETLTTGININDLRKNIDGCQTALDGELGLRWKGCFYDDIFLTMKLGIEMHRYFDHNQFCGHGDLTLNGAALTVGIEY